MSMSKLTTNKELIGARNTSQSRNKRKVKLILCKRFWDSRH